MASGDVTLSIAVEGGVTKSVTLDSATRTKIKSYVGGTYTASDLSVDANWQVYAINKWAAELVSYANRQLESETSYTAKTFTAAS